jgi:hypothetical protein
MVVFKAEDEAEKTGMERDFCTKCGGKERG